MMKPIYINPEKEPELLKFLEQHGTKKAINILFDYYSNNQLVENIVEKLKNEIDFSKSSSPTTIKKKIIQEEDDLDALNILGNFVK